MSISSHRITRTERETRSDGAAAEPSFRKPPGKFLLYVLSLPFFVDLSPVAPRPNSSRSAGSVIIIGSMRNSPMSDTRSSDGSTSSMLAGSCSMWYATVLSSISVLPSWMPEHTVI